MHKTILKINGSEYDLREDWGIWTKKIQITPRVLRETTVKVPYRSGKLRLKLSDYPVYDNQKIELPMILICDNPLETFEVFSSFINGHEVDIVLDESDHFYRGYVKVGKLAVSKQKWTFTLTLDAEPYAYRLQPTTIVRTATADGAAVVLDNEDMPVMPVFRTETEGTVKVTFGDSSFTFSSAGEHSNPGIVLKAGENLLTLTGNNIPVTITYQEGR